MSDMGLTMAAYPAWGKPEVDDFDVAIKAADQNYMDTYDLN